MSGYNGYSMSNNAVDAYNDYCMPYSKWNKSEILDAINNLNLKGSEMFETWKTSELKTLLTYSEWHHCGGDFKKVDFYRVSEDSVEYYLDHPSEHPEVETVKRSKLKTEEGFYHGMYKWTEYHPTSRYSKYKEWYEPFKNGIKKGDWIILPDGRRKKYSNCKIDKVTKRKRK